MKIALLGTGVLARVYGSLLNRAGHDVLLLGRPASVERVASEPTRLRGVFELTERLRAETVARWLAQDGSADLLLICTKAIDTKSQLAPFREAARSGTILRAASFQNGILKDRFLADVFRPERLITGETMLSAAMERDGTVVVVTKGAALLAGPADPTPFANALTSSGLPAEVSNDPDALVWSKAAIVAAGFGVGCLSRQPVQVLYRHAQLANLFFDILDEINRLAMARGAELADFPGLPAATYATRSRQENLRFMERMADSLSNAPAPLRVSMLQDLLANRPMEVEEVLGGMVREAVEVGVATPNLTLCYSVISGLEAIRASGVSLTGGSVCP